MSQDWTEKYRPKTLMDIIGNPTPIKDLKTWAESWKRGKPTKKAVVLIGAPGIGKTTSAKALASDMRWGIIEMNASDQRTDDAIRSVALSGACSNTFNENGEYLSAKSGELKLIVLDEADNLFINFDTGAFTAIAELIKKTKQPIILIVNDFYTLSKKLSVIKSETLQISFRKPDKRSIKKILRKIVIEENISTTDDALEKIAENANGDVRAAVRDLESIVIGKTEFALDDTIKLSERSIRKDIWNLVSSIFKCDTVASRTILKDIDEDPHTILAWLDENLPYEDKRISLSRGYDAFSRADIFLGRANRRRCFSLWSYAIDVMIIGICVANINNKQKTTEKNSNQKIKFPTYLMKMSRSKASRATKSAICLKLANYMHTSTNRVASDIVPALKCMLVNSYDLRVTLVNDVGLNIEELAFLMDVPIDDKKIEDIITTTKSEISKSEMALETYNVQNQTIERRNISVNIGRKTLFDF
ncbi:MAG: replication factor C large subunit [archaeon]|nr:replication factor C large subunit [archaeon]